ncbi:hypothetical protein GCM10010405_30810 [Streptomyces macrosporus]|uniref:Uncharacterized protein n=1 Tax=Streptomyces macrosporus TaxID=44032 RepID=A0ABP5X4N6_9ACTN
MVDKARVWNGRDTTTGRSWNRPDTVRGMKASGEDAPGAFMPRPPLTEQGSAQLR